MNFKSLKYTSRKHRDNVIDGDSASFVQDLGRRYIL